MSEITKRINEIRDHYRLSGNAFADKLGKVKSTVANYITGKQTPPTDFMVALLDTFPEVSAEWLFRGKGDMFNQVNPDIEQLEKEIYDLKMTILVKEGIIRELREEILGKILP